MHTLIKTLSLEKGFQLVMQPLKIGVWKCEMKAQEPIQA